jgi:hypothetical protein
MGGNGGATYVMMDDVSGANWKFKATLNGGFKIRDHANLMDVITIEPNSFANAIYIKTTDNIGIGTATPDNSALVDMTSTTKGFLPPRMTQSQIGTINNPADGLMVYCTTDSKLYIYIASAWEWKEVPFGTGTISPSFICGMPILINHNAGNIAPVTKTVTYGTINNIPGEPSKCWITQNLGADAQANAVSDATEASAGWYWQFNKMQGFTHDGTDRTPNSLPWISWIEENSDWLAANDPCRLELGMGWRIPTYTEWINVDANGNWENWNGPWNSELKLHAAGNLDESDGSLADRGASGYYWSSSQYDNLLGWNLSFNNSSSYMGESFKFYGVSIRCLKD